MTECFFGQWPLQSIGGCTAGPGQWHRVARDGGAVESHRPFEEFALHGVVFVEELHQYQPTRVGGPKVFELFTQVDRTLNRSQGGLGIGLALVARLVELHGGSAAVASDGPGKGAEFTVRLPVAGTPGSLPLPTPGPV